MPNPSELERLSQEWTSTLPSESGHYWWRAGPEHAAVMRHVGALATSFVVEDYAIGTHNDAFADVEEVRGQWFGPLLPPT
jgi:hypothetical protein